MVLRGVFFKCDIIRQNLSLQLESAYLFLHVFLFVKCMSFSFISSPILVLSAVVLSVLHHFSACSGINLAIELLSR